MTASDESRLLRRRLDALEAEVAAMARRGDCSPAAMVVKVQAAPTVALAFVSVKAVEISGIEEEGELASLPTTGDAFPSLDVGTTRPPADTLLVAELVDGLWVTQYDGLE